ncbi:phage tail protein, partial [Bacillus sonorensis]
APNFSLDKFYEKVFGAAYKNPDSVSGDKSSVDIGKTV